MSNLDQLRQQWQQMHDERTGMPSPVLVYDRLQNALVLSRREPLAVTLVLVAWEDTGGGDPAPELDRLVATRVAASVRRSDTVGMLTDRELAVVLPNAHDDDVPMVASRLMLRLIDVFESGERRWAVRPFAGVAVAGSGQFVPDAAELVRQARVALDEARVRGGGFAAYESPESQELLGAIRTIA